MCYDHSIRGNVKFITNFRLSPAQPIREILIKFLIINSWGKYEEMLWNPTNASSHKKTHITMILYVEIHSSWGKYEELAQYLARNISREEYFIREIFLARNIPREVLGQFLVFSSQGMKNLWGIFLARNIPREKWYCEFFSQSSYFPREDYSFVRNMWGTAVVSRLAC